MRPDSFGVGVLIFVDLNRAVINKHLDVFRKNGMKGGFVYSGGVCGAIEEIVWPIIASGELNAVIHFEFVGDMECQRAAEGLDFVFRKSMRGGALDGARPPFGGDFDVILKELLVKVLVATSVNRDAASDSPAKDVLAFLTDGVCESRFGDAIQYLQDEFGIGQNLLATKE